MKLTIQRADQRGESNHGWLHARFSFSFANYYDPKRMGFGKLRVLNDDAVAPKNGFGMHPHSNMEIISIPTEGQLAHKDNTGSEEIIVPGQIQVMSAGSGIMHSEYNPSQTKETRLFQIWIETGKQNVDPRHETKKINLKINELTKIVSGNKQEDTLFIYQDVSLWLGKFDAVKTIEFQTKMNRGTFIMVIEGSAKIANNILNKRDSVEIEQTDNIPIETNEHTKLLIIDTPM